MSGLPGRRALACALAAVALLSSACGARYVRTPIFDDDGITVQLRAEKRGGSPVPRSFSHPATISAVRVAHVLARLDVRMGSAEGGDRVPAFATAALYQVGEEVARAFAKADSTQEVVVQATREEKRLGLFHVRYLTSFVAWMKDDQLVIHLSRVEWVVPKDSEDEIPEPFVGKVVQDFKVLATEGVVPTGDQEVTVAWRDPVFREASHIKVGAGGKLLRRTVLIESEAPTGGEEEKEPAVLPSDLSAETLRALADLQERRTRGEISETTYHKERRDLLREAEDQLRAKPAEAPPAP